MPVLKGKEVTIRAEKLRPVRQEAYRLFSENRDIDSNTLYRILQSKGIADVNKQTVITWLVRWRKQRKQRKQLEQRTSISEPSKDKASQLQQPPISAQQIASELLIQAVGAIKESDRLITKISEQQSLIRSLNEEVGDLNAKLSKSNEERDRTLRIHNEIMKEKGSERIPTVEEVVKVLRREYRPGQVL